VDTVGVEWKLKQVSAQKKVGFQRMVQKDFPCDGMMQEIHFIRLVRQEDERNDKRRTTRLLQPATRL
jgi:hypothetical protein